MRSTEKKVYVVIGPLRVTICGHRRQGVLESIAVTDIGKVRDINQDMVFKSDGPVGILPCLYLVADGMGGHNAGDYASKFCIENFVDQIKSSKTRTMMGVMTQATSFVNDALIKKGSEDPALEGMGTTLVGAVVDGRSCLVINIGDSRMYLYRPNAFFKQISQDHSLVENMVRNGEIERRDAAHHPKKNVITRAIGVEDIAVPDFFEIDVSEHDVILLCSDGLTNMVDDETIHSVLADEKHKLKYKADRLVALANERGGKDNISVVLVEIN